MKSHKSGWKFSPVGRSQAADQKVSGASTGKVANQKILSVSFEMAARRFLRRWSDVVMTNTRNWLRPKSCANSPEVASWRYRLAFLATMATDSVPRSISTKAGRYPWLEPISKYPSGISGTEADSGF